MIDPLGRLYADRLSLLTDLYQLTMAYGYWRCGLARRQAVFHLFFRRLPFGGGFAVACGIQTAVEYLSRCRFTREDLDYLATLTGADRRPLFPDEFLRYLEELRWECDVWAVAEGELVFPREPLVRVQGPLLECQLLETPLLNLINFPTLVATKAARCYLAAGGRPILEFGLRRAQGPDGGITAARAAYVGGCAGTSNVLAGKLYGIPVRGTHAHSWVMAFPSELEAFRTYAQALPNNSILLVDTYHTLQGVRHAVEVGRELEESGHRFLGVRLDSGDLAQLAKSAREMLDQAGLSQARIVASGDLDEHRIQQLLAQGAPIDVWGVGTRLSTAHPDAALTGVYKLGAIQNEQGELEYRIKVSDDPAKTLIPGVQQVRRFETSEGWLCDVIYDARLSPQPDPRRGEPLQGRLPSWPKEYRVRDLLVPVLWWGERALVPESVHQLRQRTLAHLQRLPEPVRRLEQPAPYPVILDAELAQLRKELAARAEASPGAEKRR